MTRNKKTIRALLSMIVTCSVAAPIVCLPIGMRNGTEPSIIVRRAYAATFPEDELAEVDETAIPEDYEADDFVMNGGTYEATYLDGYNPESIDSGYSDVSPYVVYQQYDEAGLMVELLDPMFFAPDETTYYIDAPDSILKEEPDMSSMTIQSLNYGMGVTRIGIGDSWSKIRLEDGTEGYVLTDTLSYEMVWIAIDRYVWVDTDSLTLRAEPSTEGEVLGTLPDDTCLHCTGVSDKWYRVITENGTEGYVYISYTTMTAPTPTPTPIPPSATGNANGGGGGGGGTNYNNVVGTTYVNTGSNGQTVANIAVSMLGVSYVWGACSSSAVDCSGLVVYCYSHLDNPVYLPHSSVSLCSSGVAVSRENIQPGDIVCWDNNGTGVCGHVGIYVGGGQCVEARGAAWGVVYCNVDRSPIITIRRIFT